MTPFYFGYTYAEGMSPALAKHINSDHTSFYLIDVILATKFRQRTFTSKGKMSAKNHKNNIAAHHNPILPRTRKVWTPHTQNQQINIHSFPFICIYCFPSIYKQ